MDTAFLLYPFFGEKATVSYEVLFFRPRGFAAHTGQPAFAYFFFFLYIRPPRWKP